MPKTFTLELTEEEGIILRRALEKLSASYAQSFSGDSSIATIERYTGLIKKVEAIEAKIEAA